MNSAQSDAKNYVNALNRSGAGAAISLAISCGYGQNQTNPYHLASQIIVWEILGGVRSYTYPYDVKGSYRNAVSPYSSYCSLENFQTAYDRIINRMKVMGGEANNGEFLDNMAKVLTAGITLKWNAAAQKYMWKKTLNRVNGVSYDFSLENADGVKLTTTNGDGKVTLTLTSDKANIKNVKLKVTKRVMDAGKASDMKVFSSTQLSCGQVTVSGFKNVPREYTVPVSAEDSSIVIRVWKTSANPELTTGNSCYSLDGAVYGVFTDAKGEKPYVYKGENVTVTLKEQSDKTKAYGDSIPIPQGTYYIKELTAPQGYALDKKVYPIEPVYDNSGEQKMYGGYPGYCPVTDDPTVDDKYCLPDEPENDPVDVLLKKIDKNGKGLPGAQFTIQYFDSFFDASDIHADADLSDGKDNPDVTVTENGVKKDVKYTRSWVFETDSDGQATLLNPDSFVSGDDFYYNEGNPNPIIPLGTILIQETTAPDGYIIDKTVRLIPITSGDQQIPTVDTYNAPEIPNSPITIDTTLCDNSTDSHTAVISKTSKAADTIRYSGLNTGEKYTVEGKLVLKDNPQTVVATATKEFTATQPNDSVTLEYSFDSTPYPNKLVVAFAYIKQNGKEIAKHEDINNLQQSVKYNESTNINIITSAQDAYYGMQNAHLDIEEKRGAIQDNVTYSGLTPNMDYELHTQIMYVTGNKAAPVQFMTNFTGSFVNTADTYTTSFKATDSGNGTLTTPTFYFEIPYKAGTDSYKYVVFQRITKVGGEPIKDAEGKVVPGSIHEDLNDLSQTVTYSVTEIDSNAYAYGTKRKVMHPSETRITEDLTLTGLIPGLEYDIYPYLMDKSSKEIVENVSVLRNINGKLTKVVDSADKYDGCFTFMAVSETQDITIVFDVSKAGSLSGKSFVACEDLCQSGTFSLVGSHEDLNDTDQTVTFTSPTVATTATNPVTNTQYAYAVRELSINDSVEMGNLIANESYTLTGQVVLKEDSNTVLATKTLTFTAKSAKAAQNMSFTFNADGYAGKDVVVFETLKHNGATVAEHKSVNDTKQTIHLLNPTVTTEVTDRRDKKVPTAEYTIEDTVTMTGLMAGQSYTVTGSVVGKDDEAPIELLNVTSDGSSVEIADDMKSADITFKATADSQSIKIRYTINAIPYAGKWVVVFEELKYRGNTIAVHKDIDDSHQTLVFSNQGNLYIEKFDGYTGEAISGGSLLFNLYAVQNGKEVLMKNVFVCQSSPIMGAYQYNGNSEGYVDTDNAVQSGRTDLHPYYYAGAAPAGDPGTLTVYGLPAGEYVLKEKSAPDGYKADITNGETFEISAGETTELGIANSPTMIDLKLVKTDDGKGDDMKYLEGVGFTLYTDEDCNTPAKDFYGEEIGELITGSDGLLTAEKIRYNTKKETVYYISETTPLDGYQPLGYVIKAVIDTEGNVKLYKPTDEGYEEITDTVSLRLDSSEDDTELPRITNKPVRIGTTALSALTNAHQAFAVDKSQITDTVTYEGLTPDKEYTLEGVLMDKATGKELLINGEKVTAVKTFTPIADNGETTVTFTLDASALSGKSVVVFETLKYNDKVIAEHNDIEDAGQTVTFIKPNLVTSAIDKETTRQVGYVNNKTVVLDSVEYSNVIADMEYTLKTTVADSETGKEIGAPATKKFTPDSDSGTVEAEITVDSSELKGKKITVYEELIYNDVVVATHKDKDDQKQQVEFISPTVKTSATDSQTKTHYAYALENLSIVDNVQLTGLVPGLEYTVEGQLVEKSSGNVISTGENTFTARKDTGSLNITFTFDASNYAGQDLVAFETLKYNGRVIAEHKDLEDKEQTVTILNPNVETTAVDKSTNLHSGISETTSVVTDKVDLSGLIEGQNYKLKGQLINKETGEPIDVIEAEAYWSESVSGQELGDVMKQLGADISEDKKTVTVSFTARGNEETVYLDFTFDALALGNVTTVAFETLNYQGTDIAIHTDLEDSEQTVDLLGHGDITLKKVDETGSPIEGVSFSLYKDEACKNLAENCYDTFDNENGTNLGKNVSFKDVKTDKDGLATFDDLLYGTYWIKETATLNGKQLLTKVIKAELTKDGTLLSVNGKPLDIDDEGLSEIENPDIPQLPETGGIGNTIFGIIGLALIVAGAVFLINRKSNKGKSEV